MSADGSTIGQPVCSVCGGEWCGLQLGEWRACADPRCADVLKHWRRCGRPDASTAYEVEAMRLAGRAGGRFLTQLGQTDMARLTRQDWETFVLVMISAWRMEVRRLAEEKAPPF
jgi:hypothetical protein